jgi:YrbI family 3-deoxy-D-manno-octulosonate 8-phosphate phosphatase
VTTSKLPFTAEAAALSGSGDVLVVIPARGGSKGVPGKNLARVGGVPLVVRAIRAAQAASRVSVVAVSTDDPAISAAASAAGALAVHRPAELADDTASSESALSHAVGVLYGRRPENLDAVLLVQCTSPFLTSADLDAVTAAVMDGDADCAFTAAPFHGFVWRQVDAATGVNHDPCGRQRRQDRPQEWLETGAAYAMRADGFAQHNHRFFGRVVAVPTDPARVLEIDEPADLERARSLAPLLDSGVRPRPGEIDAVVLDFDGTQTDDRAWVAADGSERVAVHRGDGMGVAAMRRAGLPVLVLSTEVNPVVAARAAKLGVECRHGVSAKGEELSAWLNAQGLVPGRVLYLGNDVNDLPCFEQVGWPVAVASAHPAVRAAARAVTSVPGGHGAVREIASWILEEDQI